MLSRIINKGGCVVNIVVCTKAVPGYISDPAVSARKDTIDYTAGSIVMNESDDYALETAVALKKKTQGHVSVFTVGSLSSQKALQTGLAKGADKALRVDATTMDPGKTAYLLSRAIQELEWNLILTGVEAGDTMASQVGLRVAEKLNIPFAYAVTEVEPGDDGQSVQVVKEIGAGLKQRETIKLPALLCIQTGTTPTSFVPFRKMMMAQKKPVKSMKAADLGWESHADENLSVGIDDVFTPTDTHQAEIISGSITEIASQVLAKIKEVT
jgi:electron transfer flavoprotein beta subunit